MAVYVTSIGGKVVELYRPSGIQGEAGLDYELIEKTIVTSESGVNLVDSFPTTEVLTSVYIIQLTSECGYQYSKVTVMHNGDIVQLLESTTLLNEIRLGDFTAEIVDGNVELYCDVLSAITQITFVKSELSV